VKVLVTGAGGQVGRALLRMPPAMLQVIGLGHKELDIADPKSVRAAFAEFRPDVVINAAAYTDVDRAEKDTEAARKVNAVGPHTLAVEAAALGARMLQVSTDFVFDGSSSRPYRVDAMPAPLSVYGRSKWEGEQAVRSVLGSRACILRTAWVYDANGRNFLTTMMRLMRAQGSVRVVADQVGTPTAAIAVAEVIWALVARPESAGVFHWTDAGVASWYDFAQAIAEEAIALDLLPAEVVVIPITTEEFQTAARRPPYSVLDKRSTMVTLNLGTVHWRPRLRLVLKEMTVA
jgi:dTDP-4-dehydrorhamnose reductase